MYDINIISYRKVIVNETEKENARHSFIKTKAAMRGKGGKARNEIPPEKILKTRKNNRARREIGRKPR